MPTPLQKPTGIIRKTERATRIAAALVGAVLTVFVGHTALLRLGKPLVSASYDMPFLMHSAGGAKQIRIVYLDQLDGASLDRRPQARILDKLADAGAKAVVYDLIFDQASMDPQIDKDFADSIRRFRGVDADGSPIPGAPRRYVFLACGRENFASTGLAGEQLIPPIDVLLDAADDFGVVAIEEDAYFARRLPTGTNDEPSLIWKAAITVGAKLDENDRLQPRWLNFIGPPPETQKDTPPIVNCEAKNVLTDGLDYSLFRNKIVVIGGEPGIVGAALGKDLFATPYHRFQRGGRVPLMSGVEVLATGLANLLEENWLTRSGHEFDLNMILIAGILAGAGLTCPRPVLAITAAVGLIVAFASAGVWSMSYQKIWFPWTVVAFAQVPTALVWGIASRSYIERFLRIKISAEQEAIRAAFAKYSSPQMLDRLTTEGFRIDLGGQQVQAAMMFTDLESFTDMCEKIRSPQRIVATLNEYFERVTGSIFDHDGVIINYIGDGIFSAWGAPLADPEAPIKAAHAAWQLYQSDKLVVDGQELRTRIGLNYGEVVAGNIGSTRRVDYTLIGDAVNLASRLEGMNRFLDTSILMSDAVCVHLHGIYRSRRVGKFQVKGRRESVGVHELLGPLRHEDEPEWIAIYHNALSALEENQHQKALELFRAAKLSRGPRGDGPSDFFIKLLLSHEPIPDGIVTLTEK